MTDENFNNDQTRGYTPSTNTAHAFDKPMLRNQNSVHIPGHIVLPLPSLVVHPYPGSVHPWDNDQELRSLSEVVRKESETRNTPSNNVYMDNNSVDWELEAYRKRFNGMERRVSVASIGGDHPKKAVIIAALPILPIPAAVVCMILNILVPGLGKWSFAFSVIKSPNRKKTRFMALNFK